MKRRRIFISNRNRRKTIIIAAASAIILCFSFCIYIYLNSNPFKDVIQALPEQQSGTEEESSEPSVKYRRQETKDEDREQIINILEVNLNSPEVNIRPIIAHDEIHGYETTSSMVQRKGAYAGVNGSFFDSYGQPMGMVVIDNQILTSPQGYPVFGIASDHRAFLSEIEMEIYLDTGNKRIEIDAVNRLSKRGQTSVLTRDFGTTTRYSGNAQNLIIRNGVIEKVVRSSSPVSIPKGHHVLVSFGKPAEELTLLKPGMKAEVLTITSPVKSISSAIECGPWIIRNGRKVVPESDPWTGPLNTREPRTAVGLTHDNRVFLVTVDGRQPGRSIGLNGNELAEFLMGLGVDNAAFLDGGGSTTMCIDRKVVNTPSFQGRERNVGNALGVFIERKSAP